MSERYLIAYDLGTSGTKASLFSESGKLIGSCTEGYDAYYGPNGEVEQNPDDWWNAVVEATHKLTASVDVNQVAAVSFSGQMMGCLLVDKEGKPIRNSLIWADTRSKEEEQELLDRIGFERGYEILGHRISCSYSITKLMWVKKHEPENYSKAYKMLQAKDYIILRMTGRFVCDPSDGSGTNAMDLKAGQWSDEILEAAGVDKNLMPEIVRSIDVVGTLTEEASAILGLPTTVKVVEGGGDGPCATLGSGCIDDGQYYLTFGTSAWIAGTKAQSFMDSKKVLMTFAHVIPGKFSPTGTMQAAGSSYSYIRNTFCQDEFRRAEEEGIGVYDILNEMVESVPVGADNLLYLPYLVGERSPRWNSDASAAFVGVTMTHTKAHYIRAVLEGVAMNMDLILKAQKEGAEINSLILTGGGAKGDIVAKILADVTGCSIIRPDHVEEATSMAAAVMAGIGAGIYDDFHAIRNYLTFGDPVLPDMENHKIYQKSEKIFDDIYYALEPLYKELRNHELA